MTGPSLRAIAVGAGLGAVLAATAMYSGSKTSVVDAGNVPAALLGFAIFAASRKKPTADEGNLVQTVASSAANMAVTGGFLGPIAAFALSGHPLAIVPATAWGAAIGALGCLLAVPLRTPFVVASALPFPSARAVATVIDAVYARRATGGRLRVLAAGGLAAAAIAATRDQLGWIPEVTVLPVAIAAAAEPAIAFGIGWSPLLIGVGGMLGVRMALALVIGAVAAWLVLAPLVVDAHVVAEPSYVALLGWLLWPGIGLMIGGTFAALIASWRTLRAGLRELDDVRPGRRFMIALALAALAVIGLGELALGVPPAISALALAASAVLTAAAARATGETDNTPAGALGGLGQIAVGAIAPGGVAAPLGAGGVIQGTAMHSSAMLGNWRTGLVLGTEPRAQLVAQLIGVAVGAVASGAVFELIRRGYGLASEAMPSPVARSWAATAEVVQHGVAAMPDHAPLAAVIGAATGVALVVASRRWPQVPSPVAIGMAFLLPPYLSLTMAIGAVGFAIVGRARPAWHATHAATLASGLIAGESLVGLIGAALGLVR